jgi:hypothetical protein
MAGVDRNVQIGDCRDNLETDQGAEVRMDTMQQNLLVLIALAGAASVGALVVAALSSQSLRQLGLKQLVKRWLGH